MISKDNAYDFLLYFRKRLLNIESKEGRKFREDYEEFTATRLTDDKARHLVELLDNAHGDFERVKMLGLWADEHVSPTARKRFLTAQRQKKAKQKKSADLMVTLEATAVTRYMLQHDVAEIAPELAGLRQPDVLEFLVDMGLQRIEQAKKEPGFDSYCEGNLEEIAKIKTAAKAV